MFGLGVCPGTWANWVYTQVNYLTSCTHGYILLSVWPGGGGKWLPNPRTWILNILLLINQPPPPYHRKLLSWIFKIIIRNCSYVNIRWYFIECFYCGGNWKHSSWEGWLNSPVDCTRRCNKYGMGALNDKLRLVYEDVGRFHIRAWMAEGSSILSGGSSETGIYVMYNLWVVVPV